MSDLEKYAVRLHSGVSAEIESAYDQIAVFSGTDYADDWQDGLREFIVSLATLFNRYPLAKESTLFQSEVWACSYRFRASRTAHRILYEIVDDSQDSPYVYVLSIRHGARKPMTRAEARKIDADR